MQAKLERSAFIPLGRAGCQQRFACQLRPVSKPCGIHQSAAKFPLRQCVGGGPKIARSSQAPGPGSASPNPSTLSTSSIITPGAIYNAVATVGAAKSSLPIWKILVGSILAGSYISFGSLLSACLGGSIPGIAASDPGIQKMIMAIVFPLGLMIVSICGAELFNGNTAVVTTALLEGKTTVPHALKNLSFTLLGNWIGSVLMAAAVASSGVFSTNSIPLVIAAAKTSMGWQATFIRAVLCNWLVCLAVWMASASSSLPGKVIACWLPIFAFVAIGLENSVANMFILPLSIHLGSQMSYAHLWTTNLIPSILGNAFAGVFCVALPYALLYGSLGQRVGAVFRAVKF